MLQRPLIGNVRCLRDPIHWKAECAERFHHRQYCGSFFGCQALEVNVSSDASWLLIDSSTSITGVAARRVFTVTAAPMMVSLGVTSRATLTFENAGDNDVATVPVELSRGNVFDHTGEELVSACVGDCDGGGSIGIEELIRAVNIALGNTPRSEGNAIDVDADGQVVSTS